jgi:MFS family permease
MVKMNGSFSESQGGKLFNRNFLLLWQGQFVSQVGTQVAAVTLIFWLKDQTGLASLMGLSAMVFALTAALLTPVGGTFADRYSRKRIFIFSDIIAGVTSLALAYVMLYFSHIPWLVIAIIFLAQFIYGATTAFFSPAIFASIPDIVPKKDLARANSLKSSTFHFAMLIGQGTGAILYRILGGPVIFLIDGVSYLFSAFSEAFIDIPQPVPQKSNGRFKDTLRKFFQDAGEGIHYLWREQGVKNLVILFAVSNFFLAPFIILLPFYVEKCLKVGPEWYGYLMGGLGGGTFAGYILISFLNVSDELRSKIVVTLMIIFSLLSGSFGFVTSPLLALILFFLAGMIMGLFTIVFDTAIQMKTPSEMRGRVSGAIGVISQGLLPLGMALSGIVADLTDKNIPMIFLVAGIANFLVTVQTFRKKEALKVLAYETSE